MWHNSQLWVKGVIVFEYLKSNKIKFSKKCDTNLQTKLDIEFWNNSKYNYFILNGSFSWIIIWQKPLQIKSFVSAFHFSKFNLKFLCFFPQHLNYITSLFINAKDLITLWKQILNSILHLWIMWFQCHIMWQMKLDIDENELPRMH